MDVTSLCKRFLKWTDFSSLNTYSSLCIGCWTGSMKKSRQKSQHLWRCFFTIARWPRQDRNTVCFIFLPNQHPVEWPRRLLTQKKNQPQWAGSVWDHSSSLVSAASGVVLDSSDSFFSAPCLGLACPSFPSDSFFSSAASFFSSVPLSSEACSVDTC